MGHLLHVCIISQEGYTPLHWACVWGHVKVVEMLLKHGADAKAKDIVSTVPPSSPLYPPMTAAPAPAAPSPLPPSLLSATPCPPVRVRSPPGSFSSFPPSLFLAFCRCSIHPALFRCILSLLPVSNVVTSNRALSHPLPSRLCLSRALKRLSVPIFQIYPDAPLRPFKKKLQIGSCF